MIILEKVREKKKLSKCNIDRATQMEVAHILIPIDLTKKYI